MFPSHDQRVYSGTTNNDVIVAYGQNTYIQKLSALAAISVEQHNKNPVLRDTLLRGFLVIRRDCTDLSDTSTCVFVAADRFGQVPAEGSQLVINSQPFQTQDGDFAALFDAIYVLDNDSNSITVTLPEATTQAIGESIEFWIKSSTLLNNIVFEAYDYTHNINGTTGSNPDPVQATISAITQAYYKVTVRFCDAGTYLVTYADLISV